MTLRMLMAFTGSVAYFCVRTIGDEL